MSYSAWRSVRRSSRPRSSGAERSRGCGRRGRQSLRPRQERRGAAQMGRRQEEARREDPGGEGPIGGRAKAAAAAKAKAQAEERRQAEGRKKPGRPAAPPSEEPDPKAQKNFTDPESRIMKTKDGFIQGYNAQAAVDATAQVIVAHGLDAKQSDQHQLAPMAHAIEANLGKKRRNCRRTRAIAPTPTLQRWRNARSTPISRRAGQARREGEGGAPASPPCAKNQGRRALQPLPLKKAAARAGVRTDQAGARLPSVSLARRREGRQRVGPRLPRPQYLEARPGGPRPCCTRNRLSFATSETVQRTMAAKLPPNLTSNRMREFAASGSPTGLSGSNPISPRIKQTGS